MGFLLSTTVLLISLHSSSWKFFVSTNLSLSKFWSSFLLFWRSSSVIFSLSNSLTFCFSVIFLSSNSSVVSNLESSSSETVSTDSMLDLSTYVLLFTDSSPVLSSYELWSADGSGWFGKSWIISTTSSSIASISILFSRFCSTFLLFWRDSLVILCILSCSPIIFLSLSGFSPSISILSVKEFSVVEISLINSFFSATILLLINSLSFFSWTNLPSSIVFCFSLLPSLFSAPILLLII